MDILMLNDIFFKSKYNLKDFIVKVITTPQSKCDKTIVSFKHDVHPSEDYRWAVLREKMGPFLFQVFNITFIAPYQSILILWFW